MANVIVVSRTSRIDCLVMSEALAFRIILHETFRNYCARAFHHFSAVTADPNIACAEG